MEPKGQLPPRGYTVRTGIALFLLSAATLLYEVNLTRLSERGSWETWEAGGRQGLAERAQAERAHHKSLDTAFELVDRDSEVGGGIIAVSPGKFGIAVVSPPLDDAGNSVRAQRAIADVSNALAGDRRVALGSEPELLVEAGAHAALGPEERGQQEAEREQRQKDVEGRAAAGLAVKVDRPVVRLDGPIDRGQPQPCAAVLACCRAVCLRKRLK